MKKKLLNSLIAGILAAGMVVGTTGCGIEINADSVGEEYVNDEAEPIYDFSALRAQDDYYGYMNYSDLANMKINYFDPGVLNELIKEQSGTDWSEMYKVFNMGHRLEVYVRPEMAEQIIAIAKSFNIDAQVVGHIEEGERSLTIKSEFGEFHY